MAMRARGGGAAAQGRGGRIIGAVRPVYEEFKPASEWQSDNESHILVIRLPGFLKEQIKVSTEGQNTIRVSGEHLVAGNKWSRFQEDFQVPGNGEINSVRAKFQAGTLYITIPRKITDKPSSTSVGTQKPQTIPPQKEQEKALPPTKTTPTTTVTQNPQTVPPPKEQEKALPPTKTTPQATDENSFERKKAASDPLQKATNHSSSEKAKNIEKMAEKSSDKNKEKDVKEGNNGKLSKTDDDHEVSTISRKTKNAVMKGIAELNEERQLLVNVGVAVLVIVSLSAYVTYKFASGKDRS